MNKLITLWASSLIYSCCSLNCTHSAGIELPKPLTYKSETILYREAYTVSYNHETKIPNWVAWHLTTEHIDGDVERFKCYFEDKDVPQPRATQENYKGSGWSHGHMCPAGDNKWDDLAMRETFLLTNICPQDRSLNSCVWNRIEMDCRKWAKKCGDVYIVFGPVLLNRKHETIGKNKEIVPEAFLKLFSVFKGNRKQLASL